MSVETFLAKISYINVERLANQYLVVKHPVTRFKPNCYKLTMTNLQAYKLIFYSEKLNATIKIRCKHVR
jgi:hypothetical protein